MGGDPRAPLTDEEIEALPFPLDDRGPLLLAVSGGVDSMALMHLAVEQVRRKGRGKLLVATVDHGLRPESGDEARFVAEQAVGLGLHHVTLVWEGEKPATGIQAAAREARYRLLAGLYHRISPEFGGRCRALLTAHTLDDQAETVLMRLARGSGVDGLAGILPTDDFRILPDLKDLVRPPPNWRRSLSSMRVTRPFLAIAKSRLIATMRSRGLTWREDPSNENEAFERVRIRRVLPVLEELGITPEAIATSARRLASAREALREATRQALENSDLVRFSALGYAVVRRELWIDPKLRQPGEVALRVLAAVIRIVGGHERGLSLQSLEGVAGKLAAGWRPEVVPFATTIGRTKLIRTEAGVEVVREEGRDPPSPVPLAPGEEIIWDNRIAILLLDLSRNSLEVRSLGADGLRTLKESVPGLTGVRAETLRTMPSLWRDGRLVGVPGLIEGWAEIDPKTADLLRAEIAGPWVATFRQRFVGETEEVCD